jgi:hypothetical protein
MNKTITVYELLGLVKDGKTPDKIKYGNYYCYYNKEKNEYVDYAGISIFAWDYVVMNSLNNTVEIIEDNDKLEKIKSLNNVGGSTNLAEFEDKQHLNNHILKDKINKIIDHINKIEEKLDER